MHFHSSHFTFHSSGQPRGVCGSCWDIPATQGGIRLAQIAVSHMVPFSVAHPGPDLDGPYMGRGAIVTGAEAA